MGREFSLTPRPVTPVRTAYRVIQSSALPVPESVAALEAMRQAEPRSMQGQPPIFWHRAEGFSVSDPHGNKWLDFSSGVLVASCGYASPLLVGAMTEQLGSGVYHAYCFPTAARVKLATALSNIGPIKGHKVFLLTTGSEAVECCIKLAMARGLSVSEGEEFGGRQKRVIVSFNHAFHGRTMASQLAGGIPDLKTWLGKPADPYFVQVPFPDGFREASGDFSVFEQALQQTGVDPRSVAAVLCETYQGVNVKMWPAAYARKMRNWCDTHQALLMLDEVQAGFGRTGKWFGFEHLGIEPDLIACGKGIAGGMPLSAVIGRREVMDLFPPGSMTSTHSANPICCAAALATLETIEAQGLIANAARLDSVLKDGLQAIRQASKGRVGSASAYGLAGAVEFTKPGTVESDADLAFAVVEEVVRRGVMLFAPVGVGGCAIKICPPLVITEEALREGLEVVREVVAELA